MAGQLTIDTLKASSGVLATQNGMTGVAKAWCHWDYNTGAVVLSGSFNVSSVSLVTTGTWQVNFTTAMPSAAYAISGSCTNNSNSVKAVYPLGPDSTATGGGFSTTSCTVLSGSGTSFFNSYYNSVVIHGA
jgi:hypothetical protein